MRQLHAHSHHLPKRLLSAGHAYGTIAACYKNGFLVRFSDQLLYCGLHSRGMTPFGIGLDKENLNLLLEQAAVNQIVTYRDEHFVLYTENDCFSLICSLSTAVNATLHQAPQSYEDLSAFMRILQNYILKNGLLERSGLRFRGGFVTASPDEYSDQIHLNGLLQELFEHNASGVMDQLHYFIGRGAGLTPSGDDLLVGMLSSLRMHGLDCFLSQRLRKALTLFHTTPVSQAYLESASRGMFHSRILDVWGACRRGISQSLQKELNMLLDTGHTSGADTILGLYIGLEIVCNHKNIMTYSKKGEIFNEKI